MDERSQNEYGVSGAGEPRPDTPSGEDFPAERPAADAPAEGAFSGVPERAVSPEPEQSFSGAAGEGFPEDPSAADASAAGSDPGAPGEAALPRRENVFSGAPDDAFHAGKTPDDAFHVGAAQAGTPFRADSPDPFFIRRDPAADAARTPFPYEPGAAGRPFKAEEFRWDDVEPPRSKKERREKRKETGGPGVGLRIFSVVVSCVLVLTLGALGFVLANFPRDRVPAEREISAPDEPSASESREDTPSLDIDQTPDGDASPALPDGPLTTAQIAAAVKPSVVGVVTYTAESGMNAASEGSGIIMTEDGFIITNEHVIDGAAAVKVVLEGGEEFEASVVGADTRSDLAVIRIKKSGLTAARFGDSSKLVAGETVVAIGNPGGLKYAGSVTQGIVSATDRIITSATNAGYTINCIQTDAAINPGNSGGALVNVYGQVIGINSSKIVATGFEGIGFSIAINEAKPIIDDLIAYGYVKDRVKIGVTLTEVDEVLANLYGIPRGFQIVSIEETSDALSKGLQPGDIITKIDDKAIFGFEDLAALLQRKKAGESVSLEIYRRISNRTERTFSVRVRLLEDRGIQTDE